MDLKSMMVSGKFVSGPELSEWEMWSDVMERPRQLVLVGGEPIALTNVGNTPHSGGSPLHGRQTSDTRPST
jgi:hypothetical protein